jgi:DNA-binding MarR family transcriptional regulator
MIPSGIRRRCMDRQFAQEKRAHEQSPHTQGLQLWRARRETRGLSQLYDEAPQAAGINAAQYTLHKAISHLDAPAEGELAVNVVMDLSALGHTLEPLIRDGWAETRKDEGDARKRRIGLTKAGAAKRQEAEALWRPAQSRFKGFVGRGVSKELRELLDEIAASDFVTQFSA